MWRLLSLLVLCCAVSRVDALEANASTETSPVKMLQVKELQPTVVNASVSVDNTETLEEEMDNQENIISQLLGDYDKVRTVSSGSDCVCRCIVRPIKRSDCSHLHDGSTAAASRDFYTVETVSTGTDCKKCECMAPPSAVNPCEGEYRFKKLQEATKDDIKLATIIDLLEGSLYGVDLLKLNSVTTKLLTRVENIEKAFAGNFTEKAREKERAKERAKEKEKEKKTQQKKKKVNDLDRIGPKSGAATANKQKNFEERYQGDQMKKSHLQEELEQQKSAKNKTGTQKPVKDKSSMVIRGVTFYKAEEGSYKDEVEEKRVKGENMTLTAGGSLDLLILDEQPPTSLPFPIQIPGFTTTAKPATTDQSRTLNKDTQQPLFPTHRVLPTTATTKPAPTTIKLTTKLTSSIQPTTPKPVTTKPASTSQETVTTTTPFPQHKTPPSDTSTGKPIEASPTVSPPGTKSRISWTESPADQPKTTKKPGLCKDTVASISEPVQYNSYGFSDGAWMRDARGHGSVIYLTNGHYGNNLLEYRDMDSFKSGQASNSYKLPYSFTGTGHVVYNGAFYYNRAFSRDIIRYDLRHRYVGAWTTLHDALLEEQVHRTQTEVEFAVDESGLWLLYPALDTEGFHQEVILLIQLRPRDLQPIRSFRTGLRRGRYGNTFLVCGVLYAVDSTDRRFANVTYAFDTHTLTHTVPSLAFTNLHSHTSQVSYCPLDKKLYTWDNGHQMTYDLVFAY